MDNLSPHNRTQLQGVLANWKLTPATFAHRISRGRWIPAPHLMYISSRVAKAVARGNARIIISTAPRHGKSELLSVHTPSWLLERFPHKRVVLTGYGADLVTGFSRRVRDVFQDEDNFALLNTRIRDDAARVEAFLTEQNGGMYAIGVGGAITGRGADVLLIDDYIKEIKEALSSTHREYLWNWFVTTAFTRLEPGGSCIIIATRWHSDDLIGRILKNLSNENWEYIEIPAIAEADDLIGRPIGAPLFPERYPLSRLEELRTTLGTIFFSALYQQKPVDETAKLANKGWLGIIDRPPEFVLRDYKFARCWDLAATEDGGDYTVGTLLAYNPATLHTIVMNCLRGQYSSAQVEELVRSTALLDGVDTKVLIEQEPGSAGKALVNHYATTVLPEYRVFPTPTSQNKIVRAQPMLAAAEAGKISILRGSWNTEFLDEFDVFGSGKHDDQVDTLAAGYTHLTGKKAFSASWGRKPKGESAAQKRAVKAQLGVGVGAGIGHNGAPGPRLTVERLPESARQQYVEHNAAPPKRKAMFSATFGRSRR